MSLENNIQYLSFENYLKSKKHLGTKRIKFCRMYKNYIIQRRECHLLGRILKNIMNCSKLFPDIEDKKYFLKFALDEHLILMIEHLQEGNLDIHEVRFNDGKSALHYLAEIYGSTEFCNIKAETANTIEYFLRNPEKNYCDNDGYTYLHGACMAGHVVTVCHFLNQGLDVNLDTYTCSPLHIAAQYRRKAVVEMLLVYGANPNQQDHEQSTPLHALSWPNLCDCVSGWSYCDTKQPVDELVKMLVNYGANIEARNSCGDTPLQLAVSRFDVELTKALLKYGASLDSLNKDKMFSMNFSSLELKCYAFTLNIIDVMQLLRSSGYEMDLLSRLRMIKCWLNVRGNYTDYMICNDTGDDERDELIFMQIVNQIYIYNEFGFYIEQKATNYLHHRCEELKPRMEDRWHDHYKPNSTLIDGWRKEVAKIEGINITENVSLYKFCQMSYSKGYSIIKNVKNWHVPPMDDLEYSYLRIIVKRHIANVLISLRLKLLAADLFMTDYCKLNLPYTVCRQIAEYMSDEDLFHLFKETNENDLEQSLSV